MDRYIICGKDSDKNHVKILNCFSSDKECRDFLDSKAKKLLKVTSFDIKEYGSCDHDGNVIQTFLHIELFKKLFVDDILIKNENVNNGEIFIYGINKFDDFDEIYNDLNNIFKQ